MAQANEGNSISRRGFLGSAVATAAVLSATPVVMDAPDATLEELITRATETNGAYEAAAKAQRARTNLEKMTLVSKTTEAYAEHEKAVRELAWYDPRNVDELIRKIDASFELTDTREDLLVSSIRYDVLFLRTELKVI